MIRKGSCVLHKCQIDTLLILKNENVTITTAKINSITMHTCFSDTMLRWLRDYARSKTLFIDPQYAAATKKKLAICYAIIAYNMFGIIVYSLFKQKVPKTEDSN